MALADMLAGFAQGFEKSRQREIDRADREDFKKLQLKSLKRQLDEQDARLEAQQKLSELMGGTMPGVAEALPSPAPRSLSQVLADPQGQALALRAGYKLDDIRQYQQPSITDVIATLQTNGAIGSASGGQPTAGVPAPGGMQLSAIKFDPSGRPMLDFQNPFDPYKQAQGERDAIRLRDEIGVGGISPKQSREIAGKRAEDESKRATQAQNVTDLVKQADALLNQATGSYAGTALSVGKRAVGFSDKTSQANQKLKLISGWLVSNVPRMEGPQSEFDVKNYQEMAGMVGDTTVPIEDRRAALQELLKLQTKYAKPQDAKDMRSGSKVVDFSALPK